MTSTPRLIKNAAKCAKCDDIVVSEHRHDFKYCKCGAIAVDGGNEYIRRVGDIHNCIDMSEYTTEPKKVSEARRKLNAKELIMLYEEVVNAK